MSSTRAVLIGVAALACAVAAWLWVAGSPEAPTRSAANSSLAGTKVDASKSQPRLSTHAATSSAPALDMPAFAQPSLADVLTFPPGFERAHSLERLAFDAADTGVEAALQMLAGISDANDRAAFLRGMFARLASGAPGDAFRAIHSLPDGPDRETAVAALIAQWRPKRVALAVQASLTQRYGAIGGLIARLGDEPLLAAQAARELLTGMERVRVLGAAAGLLAASDPQHAVSFGSGLEGSERTEFMQHFAEGWARSAGEAAFAWSRQEPDPAVRDALQATIVATWAAHDPKAAAAYLPSITGAEARAKVIKALAASWGMADTQAAFAWANGLTNGQERDSATANIRESAPVGIGVVLDKSPEGYPVIRELIPGSTASLGGQLKSGYQIAAVGDGSGRFIEVRGKDLSEVMPLIRGKPGSTVSLQVIPVGASPASRVTVVLPRQQLMLNRPPG